MPFINTGYAYREQIQAKGESVLGHLARRFSHSNATQWRERIERGEIELDGEICDAATLLHAGQWLQWNRPPWEEPEAPEGCEILFEDAWLVAAIKPRGLPTLPSGGFLQQTLLMRVQKQYPEAVPMHRLGRETSGIVLFARTRAAAAELQIAWRSHGVQKFYRTLASGVSKQDIHRITTPIGLVPHPRLGQLHAAAPNGKPSISIARVIERHDTNTLFEVEIQTGRPHQIRIHMASIGHPLVGDPLYVAGGGPNPNGLAVPGDGGYFLHAMRLRFPHPASGKLMELESQAPPELRTLEELNS